jgi:hypothetical protein
VNKGVKDKGGGEKNAHQHTPLIPFLLRRLFPVLNLQSQKMPFSGEMPRALTFYVIPPAHIINGTGPIFQRTSTQITHKKIKCYPCTMHKLYIQSK